MATMRREEPTYRMRHEQLDPLVRQTILTGRRTVQMSAVQIYELLDRDRELDATPVALFEDTERVSRAGARYDTGGAPCAGPLLARGTGVVATERRSVATLAAAFTAAVVAGFALTVPWW